MDNKRLYSDIHAGFIVYSLILYLYLTKNNPKYNIISQYQEYYFILYIVAAITIIYMLSRALKTYKTNQAKIYLAIGAAILAMAILLYI